VFSKGSFENAMPYLNIFYNNSNFTCISDFFGKIYFLFMPKDYVVGK